MSSRNLVSAIDHLKAYSSDVLAAFQKGSMAGEEKFTIDLALRLLWREYELLLTELVTHASDHPVAPVCHLRLATTDDLEALRALSIQTGWSWSVRTLGPREVGDPSVVYATGVYLAGATATPLRALSVVVDALREAGVEVRDYRVS